MLQRVPYPRAQTRERQMRPGRECARPSCRYGVPGNEAHDARKGHLEQVKVGWSNDGALAGMLMRHLHLGRTMKFTAEELKKIESLSVLDVNAAVRKYIDPKKLILIRAGDLGKRKEPQAASD